MSRATSQTFLLHGSIWNGNVTASDPTTGQVFRETFSHPDSWRTSTQSIALHENIIAFGTALGRVSITDVNNRRKIDGGWKAMQQRHDFAVTALHIPPTPFEVKSSETADGGVVNLISASGTGEINLYDYKTGVCLRVYKIPGTPFLPTYMITYLDFDAESNIIIAGTCTGEVWNVNALTDTEMRRVEGTEYDQNKWKKPQDVDVIAQSGMMFLEVDVHFLSDFKNDSVFVIRENSVRRYGISTFDVAELGPDDTTYTCATIDPEQHERSKPRYFAVGDTKGIVYVYNARTKDNSIISPIYTISTVPDVKLTALAINPLVIITGSHDGTSKAYSTLTGTPLRTLCAPTSRRHRLRPPTTPTAPSDQNPIISISLTPKLKSEVRGVIAFQHGHIRSWNFAPDGVGIVLKKNGKKRSSRRNRVSGKEMKGFMNDEIERDVEEGIEDAGKWKKWEKMNGGIEEEDVAIQVALMMSREEEERRREFKVETAAEEEQEEEERVVDPGVWGPGRKISFGSTSGSVSPAIRGESGRLEDVAFFRRGKVSEGQEARRFDEDLEFAIRLSLAEQESRETNLLLE